MTLEYYFKEIEYAERKCVESNISSMDYIKHLISNEAKKVKEIINIRKELLSPTDREIANGYLELFFTDFDIEDRLSLISFWLDIDKPLTVRILNERFKPYNKNQKIFSRDPSLFECIREKSNGEKDFELINAISLKNVQSSEIFERNGFYYKVEQLLKPTFFSWCKKNFEASSIYIRLDPSQAYSKCPPFTLNEEIMIPANPNWWKNLNILRRSKEGSSYFLDSSKAPKECPREYWEYHVYGVRRLDVVAKRNGKGTLSMMLEELSDEASSSGITIGRCIHLDTDDEVGTPFNESILRHLDLAINVYEGDTVNERYEINLAKGQTVVDATFRTHLLRIENLPFKSLPSFAFIFFLSETLLMDWYFDQFCKAKMSNKV